MDTEQIKQLATDINNVALASFQSGKEHFERPLLAKIEAIEKQRNDLLSVIRNALTSLAIISMPVMHDSLDVATNEELLKIMGDSFREILANNK